MKKRTFHNRRRPLSLGIYLLAGAAGLMAGLQYLFSERNRTKRSSEKVPCAEGCPRASARTEDKRTAYFSIRRTKSELGFVYWVLHGHGAFQCFALFDTWNKALEEALRRVSNPELKVEAQWTSAVTV